MGEPTLIPDRSTPTSSTYVLPDGSYNLVESTEVVNFQDDAGEWQPIDNTFVDSPGAAYAVENAASDVEVKIPRIRQLHRSRCLRTSGG